MKIYVCTHKMPRRIPRHVLRVHFVGLKHGPLMACCRRELTHPLASYLEADSLPVQFTEHLSGFESCNDKVARLRPHGHDPRGV